MIALFLFCGLLSCAEETIKKPEDLIPKEKMTKILYDLAILNSARSINPSVLDNNDIEVMPYIYKKYGIDSAQFVNSDIYYASRPLDYEAIYGKVSSRLEREKETLEKKRREVNDSVREAAESRRLQEDGKDSIN